MVVTHIRAWHHARMVQPLYNRRQMLAGGVGALTTAAMAKTDVLRRHGDKLVRRARSVQAAGSDLGAVEHVIFLMHENRSFDHYFGTMAGVDGFNNFDSSSGVWAQNWPGGAQSTVWPFHLDVSHEKAECSFDLSHSWQAEHACWNDGAMDSFVSTHTSAAYEGQGYGPLTMGYYEQADIPFYYALARAFTLCDHYHCSVLGPTHPNRLMQMTGTLDPAGTHGGPVLVTNSDEALEFTCTWTTMPEVLTDAGVKWKVYNPHGNSYMPGHASSMELCKNVLMYFKQYKTNRVLYNKAFKHYGPTVANDDFSTLGANTFAMDVKHNRLPAVSWIIPNDGYDEHPPAPPALGEWYTAQVLATLVSKPEVWAKTVLFVMYDENDGFFDHVAPPTAPPGTPGEYVTKSPLPASAGGIAGPLGLGMRVPMTVVSPFSAGGYVCSDTFDHTSQLQFLAERFGVEVPNVSAWRRAAVGNLTTALPKLKAPVTRVAALPATSQSITSGPVGSECVAPQIIELNPNWPVPPLTVPDPQVAPAQSGTALHPTPA